MRSCFSSTAYNVLRPSSAGRCSVAPSPFALGTTARRPSQRAGNAANASASRSLYHTAATSTTRPAVATAARRSKQRLQPPQPQPQPSQPQLPEPIDDPPAIDNQLQQAQGLASALEHVYNAKLRQVKRMLSPEMLQQLQQDLSEEDLAALQLILEDVQGLVQSMGSLEEEEEADAAAAAEAALMEQIEAGRTSIPGDFHSYMLQAMPPGTTLEEVAEQLQLLPPPVLQELEQLYQELQRFAGSELSADAAAATYLDLSARMTEFTAQLEDLPDLEADSATTTSSPAESSSSSQRTSRSVGWQQLEPLGQQQQPQQQQRPGIGYPGSSAVGSRVRPRPLIRKGSVSPAVREQAFAAAELELERQRLHQQEEQQRQREQEWQQKQQQQQARPWLGSGARRSRSRGSLFRRPAAGSAAG